MSEQNGHVDHGVSVGVSEFGHLSIRFHGSKSPKDNKTLRYYFICDSEGCISLGIADIKMAVSLVRKLNRHVKKMIETSRKNED